MMWIARVQAELERLNHSDQVAVRKFLMTSNHDIRGFETRGYDATIRAALYPLISYPSDIRYSVVALVKTVLFGPGPAPVSW